MQDYLPDVPEAVSTPQADKKISLFSRFKGAGGDDKRLVKVVIFAAFMVLILLGIVAAILETVAPRNRGNQPNASGLKAGLWQIEPQPGQIILGFYLDTNHNLQFDYQEKPFAKVSVAIRRRGETEPFRRVASVNDGLVKIDDLSPGSYEISLDNYVQPEAGLWQFFEDYQKGKEFFPTAWQVVDLADKGYKEFIGINAYQPPLLLSLATPSGLVWYDPARARVFAQADFGAVSAAGREQDVYYLAEGKLQHMDWVNRAIVEEMIWLEEAEAGYWQLSPLGKTVAYLIDGRFYWRSQEENCAEGGLLVEGIRPEIKQFSFLSETTWLMIGRDEAGGPWELMRVDCESAAKLATVGEPLTVGALVSGHWFYSTAEATYLVDPEGKAVKYTALGGGEGVAASQDGRYLLKKLSASNWLVVDFPAVKSTGVEQHYLLSGISGEPAVLGEQVYYVRAKDCEADGDCGEVVQVRLEGSGVWSVKNTWDLKNVPATKVLGVVE